MNGNTIFEMYRKYRREGVEVEFFFFGGGGGVFFGRLSDWMEILWDLKISLALDHSYNAYGFSEK